MDWRALPALSSLRAFTAVAETHNVSRAGEALNVTQAAVSQQIHALERHLGIALVVREGHGVALTPQGKELARVLQVAFASIGRAVGAITESEAIRPLQVSLTPTFANYWFMPRIAHFQRKHPDIQLVLDSTAQLVELMPGGTDIAVRFGDGRWPGLRSEPLILTDLVIVAAPSLIGSRQLTSPATLLDYPWLQEFGTEEVTNWLASRGVIPDPQKLRITQLPGYMVTEATRNGQGVCAQARVWIEADIDTGRLVVLFTDDRPNRGYHIVTRPEVMRPPLKAFVAWLRRQRSRQNPARNR